MLEQIINIVLSLKSFIRQTISSKEGKGPNLKNYNLVLNEEFKFLSNWKVGLPWTNKKIKDNIQFCSKSAVTCNQNGLNLKQIDTKYCKISDDILSRNAIGITSSLSTWKYGIFEISASLPIGENLCPSICLVGCEPSHTKIQILKAYSDVDILYSKDIRMMTKFITKLSYNKNVDNSLKKIESKQMYHSLRSSKLGNFIKFTCVWESDKIEMWYNGYLVRKITNAEILKQYNHPMHVLLSHSIILYALDWPKDSEFKIESVKIYQK